MVDRRVWGHYLLLVGAVVAAMFVYLGVVPRHLVSGDPSRALLYFVVGWVPYVLAFYLIGRLFSSPEALPNMRAADIGLAIALILLLLSLGLDAWGFTPEQVPEAHVIQSIGIFVGLALFGWGIGRRSNALATHK